MSDIGNRLWSFCHTLRHDGIDYGDYIEQLTYLLFLKMADETGNVQLPSRCSWPYLRSKEGSTLVKSYSVLLRRLSRTPGILGDIYADARSRFNRPESLERLLELVDEIHWTSLDIDVKGRIFEELLEKAASAGKKGAGQYFTPRVAIRCIVRCIKPDPRGHPSFKISDPAAGTAGFLVAAYEWLVQELGGRQSHQLLRRVRSEGTYYGEELVARPRRLGLMNMYLHGIVPTIRLRDAIYDPPIEERFDVVLTNPPFGSKGARAVPKRPDFRVQTSDKQLNFLQHVLTILKPEGRAAIVLPDSSLFADKAGEVLEDLTQVCDLHTVLRLPRGTFAPYSNGVRANVLFFSRGTSTKTTWIYDGRTNVQALTKKDRPLTVEHFVDFERCYGPDPDGRSPRQGTESAEGRWKSFCIDEIKGVDFKLDRFRWLKESAGDGYIPSEPEELLAEIMDRLRRAMREAEGLAAALDGNGEQS